MEETDIWKDRKWQWLDVDLECFDYFIRHVFFTEMRLCAIQTETNAQCKVCKKDDEGILHLFLFCEKLTTFFEELKEIIIALRDKGDLNWEIIFFARIERE